MKRILPQDSESPQSLKTEFLTWQSYLVLLFPATKSPDPWWMAPGGIQTHILRSKSHKEIEGKGQPLLTLSPISFPLPILEPKVLHNPPS